MTKGAYTVGEDAPNSQTKDTSYRSFICALLIFLCICLIILLASINWGGRKHEKDLSHGGEKSAHTGEHMSEDNRRNEARMNKTHERIRNYDETTTEKRVIIKEVESVESFEEDDKTTPENRVIISRKEIDSSTQGNKPQQYTSGFKDSEEGSGPTTETNQGRIINGKDTTLDFIDSEETSTEANQERIKQKYTSGFKDSEEESEPTTEVNQERIRSGKDTTLDNIDSEETSTEANQERIKNGEKTQEYASTFKDYEETSEPTTEANQGRIRNGKDTTRDNIDEERTSTEEAKLKYQEFSTTDATDIKEEETTTEESAFFAKIKSIISSITENITDTSATESVTLLTTSEQNIESYASTASSNFDQQNEDDEVFRSIINSTTEAEEPTTVDSTEPTKILQLSSLVLTTTPRTTNASSTTEISLMESEPDYMTESVVVKTETFTSSPLTKTFNPVCRTEICKTVSSRMLSMMNYSAAPCDAFYDFACGRAYQIEEESSEYQDVNLLQEQLSRVNESSLKFVQDFRDFYQSCLKHEDHFNYWKRMKKLEGLLEEVGRFQFNETTSTDFTDLVSSLLLRQSMPLFDIGVDVDKQSSNFILQLNLPHQSFLRTGVEDWSGLSSLKKDCLQEQKPLVREDQISLTDVYKLFESCQSNYLSYLDSVESVIRDLGAFSNLSSDVLLKEVKEIRFSIEFDVLNNLDTLPSSATILRSFVTKQYEIRRIADLQRHFGVLDWKKLFGTLTGREIQGSTLVQVYFADYFQNVFTQLKRVDQKKLNNAFLAIHAYDLFFNTVIPKEKSRRDSFCTDLSKKLLPDVWTYFVRNAVPKNQQDVDKKKVSNLFEELKRNFCKSLLVVEWIDQDTKVAIIKKCNNLNLVVFSHADATSLAKNYQEVNITKDYQTNLLYLLENFKRMVYSTEGTPISGSTIFSYFLDPLGAKPLTFYANPMIVVPLGLMRKTPNGIPNYLVKIRAGFAIARQLARHFDPTGMTYGIRLTSTSKSSYFDFVETMKTLMDYSSPRDFNGKKIIFALNGTLSLNERIVDNAAFRLIYDSVNFAPDEDLLPWLSGDYSREKVIFIAMAQEMCKKTSMLDFMLQVFEKRHLPAVLRVENVIGNSEQFSDKFGCAAGSGMDFPVKMQFPFVPMVEEEYEGNDDLYQG